jgi:ribokinase
MAAALAHLGVPTRFLTVVGEDDYGHLAVHQLQEAGVDTSTIIFDTHSSSGVVIILIDDQNERTIIPCALGAAYEKLNASHVDALLARPAPHVLLTGVALGADPVGSSYVHLSRILPPTTTLYFDPNLRQPPETIGMELAERYREISARADVLMAGTHEIEALGLKHRQGQILIEKAGAKGAWITDADGKTVHIPAEDVDVIDSTGAGDAFAAGFVAARARSYDVLAAARCATRAGALAVQALGARVPTTWNQIDNHQF